MSFYFNALYFGFICIYIYICVHLFCFDLYLETRKKWKTFMLFYPTSQGKMNNYQLIAILHNFMGQILLLQREALKVYQDKSFTFLQNLPKSFYCI